MTLAEALETVVRRTGHQRYHWLCSDANPDPLSRESYRTLVQRLAGSAPPSPQPDLIRRHLLLLRWARACLYADRAPTGCACAFCHWKGRKVHGTDCLRCLGELLPNE